jgi:hypothetical protein
MRRSSLKAFLAATVIVAGCCAQPAFSSRPPDMVSGTVSAVSGTQIVVNGQSYGVKANSPALRALQGVQVGTAVDLVLNGPPQAAATQVIAINVHAASR